MKTTKFAKIIALVLTLALLVGSVMTLSVSAEEAAADTTGKILAQSVIYGEKTYIMFAVQAENASDVTVTYTWEGDETVYTASVYDGAEYEGAVIFVTDGVALYELGKKVTASVSVGGAVVDTKTYSVAEFLYRQLYNNGVTGDQKEFYESLLVCGANAQKYIAKETENLVTDLTYVYTDNAEVTVNGGKYALVNDGATVELAYTGKLPVLSWTVGETTVETDAKTYTATVSGDSVKVDVTAYNYDPSYMTFKGENAYYISDFNNASVLDGVTQEHISPWGTTVAVVGNTVGQGNLTNGHGTFTGITFQRSSSAGNAYGSFNYALPSAFDLTQADTIVFKFAASAWHNGYANSYFTFKSGTEYVNLTPYLKIYRGSSMAGITPDQLSGSVISGSVGNYLTAYVELDVAAFIEATGKTSIDGLVFGLGNDTAHVIDEIYFTVPHEHEFVEGKCECGEEDPNYVPPMPDYDPSYMTQKGEGTYYISDFNNASVMEGVTEETWNDPWFNYTETLPENGTVTQGTYSTAHGTFTGLHYTQEASGYTGFSYELPAAFDLSQASTIVVRIAYNGWSANYANCYILVKSGDNVSKVLPYSKMYATNNATIGTTAANTIGSTISVNFMTCFVEIDVAALVEASGFTSIDAIYFGQNNTGFNFTVDEIYYTAK